MGWALAALGVELFTLCVVIAFFKGAKHGQPNEEDEDFYSEWQR